MAHPSILSSSRFVTRSLAYYWRTNLAVALGVVAATAVLAGALIVGDSVRGSLRDLTLDRLGRVDEVLVTDRFFRAELAEELAANPQFRDHFQSAQAAILLPAGTVERVAETPARAGQVFIIGADPEFWQLGSSGRGPNKHPGNGEIVLNEPLARDLGARIGDSVTLRLPDASQVPADSTLGQKDNRIRSLPRLTVIDILPAEGLGRFSLQPNQRLPKNAYVSRSALADILEEEGRVNAILVAGAVDPQRPADEQLEAALKPTLEDLGLNLTRVRRTFPEDGQRSDDVLYDYFSVTTDRMVFEPAIADAALQALSPFHAQPVLTYLADSIRKQPAEGESVPRPEGLPYSTITAIENSPSFPLLPEGESLGADEIVLNRWAADQLGAEIGDKIVVSFFQPETIHGEHVLDDATFTLRAIVPLTEPARPYRRNRAAVYDEPPTIFNDPDLTPVVKGITDQESIEDWDAPFPFDIRRMQAADDDYWDNHRTTPKAFVSLVAGQKLWGSRFGNVTSIRVPVSEEVTESKVREQLSAALRRSDVLASIGMSFAPVKAEGLAASAGTTPFDVLFLMLSFFIILAAVLLIALMFRLGVDRRATQLGMLSAVGLGRRQTTRLLVAEGALLASVAGLFGAAAGVGYAALMIHGLTTWWVDAIAIPFLSLHVSWLSLLIGYVSGTLVSVAAIYASARRLHRLSARRLLTGNIASDAPVAGGGGRRGWRVGWVLLALAAGLAVYATQLSAEAQAAAFVGGGALLLAAMLLLLWTGMRGERGLGGVRSVWRLSMSNAARSPTRSVLTIGLVAAATFLIVSMGAFRLRPTLEGSGGFRLIARSSAPIYTDLGNADAQNDLFGAAAESLREATIFSFRVKPGDDASCRNLYQVARPQVFGVPRDFMAYYDSAERPAPFTWRAHAELGEAHRGNPWRLLETDAASGADAIPVVLDNNTALYSLKWYGGVGSEYTVTYEGGQEVRFRIAGLLANSVLQGALLIDEDALRRTFPEVNGFQYFLIDAPPDKLGKVQEILENGLSDQGLDVVQASDVLADFLAVQNTYLSTFQSLGALGLLLGTFGLASVQVRSVLERRGELALLRAQGFRRSRIGWLVLLENTALLLGGLGVGVLAALCAVVPHTIFSGASLPWGSTFAMLAAVLVIGTLAGLFAVRASVNMPLVASLRAE